MSDYENDGNYFDVWSYVARLGCRVRPSSDPFFADGDTICQVNKILCIRYFFKYGEMVTTIAIQIPEDNKFGFYRCELANI